MRSKWIILKQTYLCYFFIIHHDPFPNALWMMIFTYKWQQGLLTQLFDHITMIRLFFIFYYLQIRKPLKHLFCLLLCASLPFLFQFHYSRSEDNSFCYFVVSISIFLPFIHNCLLFVS